MTISYHSGGRLQGIGTVQEVTAVVGLSACSYDSVEVTFGSSGSMGPNQPMGIAFSPDGVYLYVSAQNSTGSYQEIFQWALSTAWDLTTIGSSYYKKKTVLTSNYSIKGINFKPDGTKVYFLANGQDRIYEWNLSTAWDISTATSYSSKSTSSVETQPYDFCFNDDGTIMLTFGNGSDRIYEWDLSTAWSVSTASASGVYVDLTFQTEGPQGIVWSNDGKRIWYCQGDSQAPWGHSMRIREVTLSTAWDLSTVSSTSVNYNLWNAQPSAWCITKKADDTKLYIGGNTTIRQYDIQITAGQEGVTGDTKPTNVPDYSRFEETNTRKVFNKLPDTLSYDSKYFSVASQESTAHGISFKPDGTKMYVSGFAGDAVWQYSCSTAWDVSTASYDSVTLSVSGQDTVPIDVFFKTDGSKMYIIGSQYDKIYQYSLSTYWDLSTASYDSVSFSFSTQTGSPGSLSFSDDGTKMYIGDEQATAKVYQYTLSTGWDLSTASYASKSKDVDAQCGSVGALTFNSTGTKMYIVGYIEDKIFNYTLSTAWDVSTASYDSIYWDVNSQESSPGGLFLKLDGTKMYVVGNATNTVYQYSLSENWKEKGTT